MEKSFKGKNGSELAWKIEGWIRAKTINEFGDDKFVNIRAVVKLFDNKGKEIKI